MNEETYTTPPVTGYRTLTQSDVDLMKRIHELEIEIGALHKRREDAELILWHAIHADIHPETPWITTNGKTYTLTIGEDVDGDPIEVDGLMQDGLPVLTDGARERLRKELKR